MTIGARHALPQLSYRRCLFAALVAVLLLAGCQPSQSNPPAPRQQPPAAQAPVGKTSVLTVAIAAEPKMVAATLDTAGATPSIYEFVSQGFTSIDQDGNPVPKLIESIPSIDDGSWRVTPSGVMETTYHLRPNLQWHDGQPITIDDIRFTLQVYADPQVPVNSRVAAGIEQVQAIDEHTFEIRWKQPYAFADRLTFRELTVLPAHLLAPLYEQGPGLFTVSAYWSNSFVGSGPYRLRSWAPGVSIDLVAFDQYFLGRPQADNITIRFLSEESTLGSQIQSGSIDLALQAFRPASAVQAASRFRQSRQGDIAVAPGAFHTWAFQYANNPAAPPLEDVRVRRALTYGLARDQLAAIATGGSSVAVDGWIPRDDPRYQAAESAMMKYPPDANRAKALLAEAGWTPGGDGLLKNAAGESFQCEVRAPQEVAAPAISLWRVLGVDTKVVELPLAQARDPETRVTFPCVSDDTRPLGPPAWSQFLSSNVATAATGWRGANRTGWSNPELDLALDRLLASPMESERLAAERDALRILTSELPVIPLYIDATATFVRTGVEGWRGAKRGMTPDGSESWNAHLWAKT